MAQPTSQVASSQTQSSQRLLSSGSYASWATEFKNTKDLGKQLKFLQELKDHVDARTGDNPLEFFQEIVGGVLLTRLKSEPSFVGNFEHRIRTTCLEILERAPRSEPIRNLLPDILYTLVLILERDTEDNAVIALRILSELHRSQGYENEAQQFLDVIRRAHSRLPQTLLSIFSKTSGATGYPSAAPGPPDPNKKEGLNEPKTKAELSLKIISESHTSILLLYKSSPSLYNLSEFIPLFVTTLQVQAPEGAISANRSLYTDLIAAQSRTLSVLTTIIAWVLQKKDDQVKLQELATSLRSLKDLPRSIVQLLKNCPSEAITTRKEILISLRQMVTSQTYYHSVHQMFNQQGAHNASINHPLWAELWSNFSEQIDDLLDERTLIGVGRTPHETVRSHAWTVVAEYINQSRNKLTVPQLVKLVEIYGRNAHDPGLPASAVTLSIRLLSKLSEVIGLPDQPEPMIRSQLLTRILDVLANKLSALKRQIPRVVQHAALAEAKVKSTESKPNAEETQETDQQVNSLNDMSEVADEVKKEDSQEKMAEKEKAQEKLAQEKEKALFEATLESALAKDDNPTPAAHLVELRSTISITFGALRTVISQLSNHYSQHKPAKNPFLEETYVLNRMFRHATKCLTIYDTPKLENSSSNTPPASTQPSKTIAIVPAGSSSPITPPPVPPVSFSPQASLIEAFEKDCTNFSLALLALDFNIFEDILTANLPYLYSNIVEYPFLCSMIHFFITTNTTGATPGIIKPYIKTLNDILLTFLITKIPNLGTADPVEVAVIHRLFKAVFQAIGRTIEEPNFHPTWAPQLSGVVTQILRLATETKDPYNYFILLKYLFRGIPKTDIWSKELAHSLPTIVDTMNKIQENASSPALRDLLIEIPLTLPIRPSCHLPCFKLFIKPLLLALEATDADYYTNPSKCVNGLRFLENYIGQFSAEFMEPLFAEHKNRLLKALWKHLRPPPFHHTSQVMRILGKMGGRIRPFVTPQLPVAVDNEPGLVLTLTFDTQAQIQREQSESESEGASKQPENLIGDPLPREQRIIEIRLEEAVASARRTLLAFTPSPVPTLSIMRRLNAFNFLKSCLAALLRPFVDSPQPTKQLRIFNAEDVASLESLDISHPARFIEKSEYPSHIAIIDPTAAPIDGVAPAMRCKSKSQLDSEQHILKLILSTLITSNTIDSLKEASTQLLDQICTHFALIYVSHSTPDSSNLKELDPTLLLDAIVEVLASENRDHAPAALAVIDNLIDTCLKFDPDYVAPKEDKKSSEKREKDENEINESASTPFMFNLPALNLLVQRLCDICFKREWYFKAGGCLGIRHLVTKMPASWVRQHQLAFLQAVLFLIKDYPLGATAAVSDEASQTFLKILRVANSTGQMVSQSMLEDALMFLAQHLSSTSSVVRRTVQAALDKLAEWSGSEVTELLEPHKQIILEQVLAHPLARIGNKLQMAYLDAIGYCLNLRPPLLPNSHALRPFLSEAVQLTEQEETSRNHSLHVALIDLLAAAVGWTPFQGPEYTDLRNRTIYIFLKTLPMANKQLMLGAKKGLEQVVACDLMSRKILQEILSPTLAKLAEGKFTEHMLDGLSRFLGLFPKFFTPELGRKLLEQLGPYTDPNAIPLPKLDPSENHHRIAAAVLDICHLLPSAGKLLDQVVKIALKLEALAPTWAIPGVPPSSKRVLPKELTSIFRAPLAKYLNRFPAESITYFFSQLREYEYSNLFCATLKSEHAPALREELAKQGPKLIDTAFKPASTTSPEDSFHLQYAGIVIVKILLGFYPEWLSQNRDVYVCLHAIWKSPERIERFKNETSLSLRHSRETTLLLKCLLHFLKQNHQETTLFLDLMSILISPHSNSCQELLDFYSIYVVDHFTIPEKRAVLERVLADYNPNSTQPPYSIEHRLQIFKTFVIPVLTCSFERKEDLLTNELLNSFITNIFAAESVFTGPVSSLSIELLSLMTLLLKHCHTQLVENRREIIKFGWHFLKNEDLLTKQNANVMFSRFIEGSFSSTPAKIRLQVYVALLRSHQTEVRSTVREALELLVPTLLSPTLPDEQGAPRADCIKWTKRVLSEESQQPVQLIHILYLIAKFEPYFRPWRSLFYSSLASSIPKLSPQIQQTAPEQKKMAVAVVELLLSWERIRIKNQSQESSESASELESKSSDANAMEITSKTDSQESNDKQQAGPTTPQPSHNLDQGDGKLPAAQIDSLLTCLIAAALVPQSDLAPIFLRLFRDALTIWSNSTFKFHFLFSRVLEKVDDPKSPHAKALTILEAIFTVQPASIPNYSVELGRCLPALVFLDSPEVGKALNDLLKLLLKHHPLKSNSPLEPVYTAIITELEKAMVSEKPAVDNILMTIKTLLHKEPSTVQTEEAKADSKMEVTESSENQTESKSNTDGEQIKEEGSSAPPASDSMEVDVPVKQEVSVQPVAAPAEPDVLAPLVTPLLKLALKLKDVILAKPEIDPQTGQPIGKKPDSGPIFSIFKLLAPRISSFSPESRRTYIGLIQLLIEKSSDESLLTDLVVLTESFLSDPTLNFDNREKNSFLQRLRRFEKIRVGSLSRACFDLIYNVYKREKSSEISNLEPAFMQVLTCRDSSVRNKFMAVFSERFPKGFVTRLEQTLRHQTWEALPHMCWIQPTLELLLSQADSTMPIVLGVTSARVPQPKYLPQSTKSQKTQSNHIHPIFDREKAFLEQLNDTKVSDLIGPLCDLLHQDPDLAGSVWSNLFESIMKSESGSSKQYGVALGQPSQLQRKLVSNIQAMLTNDSMLRPQRLHPIVAQTLLRGIHASQLHLAPSLVKYVGSTFNAWHLAIKILEDRIFDGFCGNSPDAPPGVVVQFPNHNPTIYSALGDLYSKLGEEDWVTGLLLNQSVMQDTRAGLILEQQGAWSRAQEVFYQALHDSSKGIISQVPEREQELWESHWIECAKRLNQWDVISSYAKSVGSGELIAEASWKLGDWEGLKEVLNKFPSTETAKGALLHAYSQLHDRSHEVDSPLLMNLTVSQWSSLPKLPSPAFTPLLVVLQRIIDIHDSAKIIKDLKSPDFMSRIPDIKTVHFRAWRERLLHECDDMVLWHDVLQWRQHMFSMLTHTLASVPQQPNNVSSPLLGLGHHEAAWAINKMAHVARKQGLVDICFSSLPKIYELPNIEVQDAFTKVCEHIKSFFKLPLPLIRGVLDIINSTNLNYFTPTQKAEFHHLKAEFYQRTGAFEESAKAYSTAVLLYPSLPKVWSGWGKFYDERFEALLTTSSLAAQANIEMSNESQSKSKLTAAHYALSCYLLALKANPQISSRKMLVRVLWILGYDQELCSTEEASGMISSLMGDRNQAHSLSATQSLTSPSAVPSTPQTPAQQALSASSFTHNRDGQASTPISTPATESLTPTESKMDTDSPAGSSPDPRSQDKKREASSPVDGDRNPKRRKLTETGDDNISLSEEASTKGMEVDEKHTPLHTPATPSTMFVPPTPNTPATPSAMFNSSIQTPGAPTTPGNPSKDVASQNADKSSQQASVPTPDPLLVEINHLRKGKLLSTTFLEHAESFPCWLWLIWIPQLLTSLDRPECLATQTILKKVATQYPHALYFPLTTFIMERRNLLADTQALGSQQQQQHSTSELTNEKIGLKLAEELLNLMKEKLPTVISDLEKMTMELSSLSTLSTPEELIDAFNKVIQTSYDHSNLASEERKMIISNQISMIYYYLFIKPDNQASDPSSTISSTVPSPKSQPAPPERTTPRRGKSTRSSAKSQVEADSQSASNNGASALDQLRSHPNSNRAMRSQLRSKFEEDFGFWISSSMHTTSANNNHHGTKSIRSVVEKMKTWIEEMKKKTSRLSSWVELSKSSWLSQFQNENTLEIPGLYLEDKEMVPDTSVFIDKFESPIKVTFADGLPRRIITIRGSNGTLYHWQVESCLSIPYSLKDVTSRPIIQQQSSLHLSTSNIEDLRSRSANKPIIDPTLSDSFKFPSSMMNLFWQREQRFCQLIRHMVRILQKDVHIRKRCVNFAVPHIACLTPFLRLTSIDRDFSSLHQIFDEWCNHHSKNPMHVLKYQLIHLMEHKPKKTQSDQMQSQSLVLDSNQLLDAYEGSRRFASDEILLNYVSSTLSENYEYVWHMKKAFVGSLAIHCLLQHLFSLTKGVTPQKFLVFPSSGQIQVQDMVPHLNSDTFEVAPTPESPLRLTPNLLRFIGPAIHGSLLDAVLTASCIVLSKPNTKQLMTNHMQMYFRDDLIDLRREKAKMDGENPETDSSSNPTQSIQEALKKNVNIVVSRLEKIAPPNLSAYRSDTTTAINEEIAALIDASMDPYNASKMPVSWASWI